MMIPDPTEQIKVIRHRLGAEFDYDLEHIVADIQRRQSESGREYITMPPRKIKEYQSVRPGTGLSDLGLGTSSPIVG